MARPKSLKPKYCLHRASGLAYVTLDGREVWLGKHGSQESRDKYDQVIGEWIAKGRKAASAPVTSSAGLLVAHVIHAFWQHAQTYYVQPATNADGTPKLGPDGKAVLEPSEELENYRWAIRPLRKLYGETPATDFGPLALQSLRAYMAEKQTVTDPATGKTVTRYGWCRKYINRQILRVKAIFKWAVSREMIPPSVYEALRTVDGLRQGKTEARESDPVKPVSEACIDATLAGLSKHVGAMVKLQLLTGARSGELFSMRTCDIDKSGPVWVYRPVHHKTAHHGHAREIWFGPQAQEVLSPLLRPDLTAYIFSPADAVQEWMDDRRKKAGKKPAKSKPLARPRYNRRSYGQAIERACDRAFPPPDDLARGRRQTPGREKGRWETESEWRARLGPEKWAELQRWQAEHRWHPHQLRHSAATKYRREYGLEIAQILLGHSSKEMTELYAERDVEAAKRIVQQVG